VWRKMSEEIKKIEGENNIPTIEEMKKEALKLANNIPNLKEKHQFMIETRGNIIELSIIIETCFNQLITETGKEMVFDHGKKELHLMKGIRTKNEISGLKRKSKSADMKHLIENTLDEKEKSPKLLFDAFDRLFAIRDIFAHVPVKWSSPQLEFDDGPTYKHFFKLEPLWKNVFVAYSEFTQLHQWVIDVVLNYNRIILLKKEILSLALLGKSQAEIRKLAKNNKNETTNTN